MSKLIFLIMPLAASLVLAGASGIHAQEGNELHRTIFSASFDDVNAPQSRISLGIGHAADQRIISRYTENKNQTGIYSQTQQNLLICDGGPCEQLWSASFVYTDQTGKKDAFALTWKQIVFDGMTPMGTSKRELNCCVNGKCINLEDTANAEGRCVEMTRDYRCKSYESTPDFDKPQTATIGRYLVTWRKSTLAITRLDIK